MFYLFKYFVEIENERASRSVVSDSLRPRGHNSPGSSVHGILQARILEWVAIPFSRESSQPRDQTQVSRVAGGVFPTEPGSLPFKVCVGVLAFSFSMEPCKITRFQKVKYNQEKELKAEHTYFPHLFQWRLALDYFRVPHP